MVIGLSLNRDFCMHVCRDSCASVCVVYADVLWEGALHSCPVWIHRYRCRC